MNNESTDIISNILKKFESTGVLSKSSNVNESRTNNMVDFGGYPSDDYVHPDSSSKPSYTPSFQSTPLYESNNIQQNVKNNYFITESSNGYSVKSDGQSLIENLDFEKSANIIQVYLERTNNPSYHKINEVLELEEDYRRYKNEVSLNKSRYNKAKEIGEKECAQVFKTRFYEAQAKSTIAKDSINAMYSAIIR